MIVEAVRMVTAIVEGYDASRRTTQDLQLAERALEAAMTKSTSRAEYLAALGAERSSGRLSDEVYGRLLSVAARLLKSNVDVADACARVLSARERS